MKIAVACDHRGFEAKKKLLPTLRKLGHEVEDFGCDGSGSVDYPDYAVPVARLVADGKLDAGILLDGSGIGMSIAANKVHGVRAALAHDEVTARRAREHNHCNVLCMGTDLLSEDQLRIVVEIFLATSFGEGRHLRRVEKLKAIERQSAALHDAPANGGTGAHRVNADHGANGGSGVNGGAGAGASGTNGGHGIRGISGEFHGGGGAITGPAGPPQ